MGIRPPYHYTPLPGVLQVEQIVSLHYYEYEEGFMWVIEDHDFWELVYVDAGAVTCRAGDLRLSLTHGQAILHPPMERHQIITSGQTGNTYIFSFTCPQLRPDYVRGRPLHLGEAQHQLVLQARHYGRQLYEGPYDELFQPQLYLRKQTPYGGEQLLRSCLVEEMGKEYARTAYSRGNSTKEVMYRHLLKNAMIPVITFLGMTLSDMIAGSIVVEQVFSIPGLGRILLSSISNRDYPVVEAIIVLLAFFIIFINFLVDYIYKKVDPRIRVR